MGFSFPASLLQEVTDILSARFGTQVQIHSAEQLSGSERRNLLLRIRPMDTDKNVPKSLIFKQTLVDNSTDDQCETKCRFARDWAGLEFLNSLQLDRLYFPRFYGGGLAHNIVLFEDFGREHISLVDSLTGGTQDEALDALRRLMTCMGRLHADSYGHTDRYFEILKKVHPQAERWEDDIKVTRDEMLSKFAPLFTQLGVPFTERHLAEIDTVINANLAPGAFTTFIHGDICPDNVFDFPDRGEMLLIDFEWGFVRSALLDGTYLRMSMPTCWCAKAIPEDVIEPLEMQYRAELMKKIPAASSDKLYHDAYVDACAYWMLGTMLLIEGVLDKDDVWASCPIPENCNWEPKDNRIRPRILSRLNAFLAVAAKHDRLPHLRSMAQQLIARLHSRWPDAKPLDLYPAFSRA